MGVGHVPQDPIHPEGEGAQLQGRERRGAAVRRAPPARDALAARRLARARWAENLVARWYVSNGYAIVARNWTTRGGELDVVATKGRILAVCEVKARATDAFGAPAEALTPTKQTRVRRTGFALVEAMLADGSLRARPEVRFDLACVLGTALEMHLDAF